jgi:hypothetical protein
MRKSSLRRLGKRLAVRLALVVIGVALGFAARWVFGPPATAHNSWRLDEIPPSLEHIGRDLKAIDDGLRPDLPLDR